MLEPNGAAEVEYVQMKKMKKRRELNALVTNGKAKKMGIGKRKMKGQHELLQNEDSGSSEIDEFSIDTEKAFVRNRSRRTESKVCSRCVTVVTCVLSLLCIAACAGLAWVHIELKKDFDSVRVKLSKVETQSKGFKDDGELQKQMKTVFDSLIKARGPLELKEVKSSFDAQIKEATKDLSKKVTELEGEVARLKESVESAPALKTLPDKVDTLTQSVATVKGDLRTVSDLVKGVSDKEVELEKSSKVIQQRLAVLESKGVSVDKKDSAEKKPVEGNDMNLATQSSLQASLKTVQDAVSSNELHLEHLTNVTEGLTLRLELLEQKGSHSTSTDQSTMPDWASIVNAAVEKALEKVSNKTAPSSQSVNSSTALSDNTLSQLTEHMSNISSQLLIYKSQADEMRHDFNLAHTSQDSTIFNATQSELVTQILHRTLEDYKLKYNLDMQTINSSVQSLDSSVQTLTGRVTSNNAQIMALATTIQQLAQSSVHNAMMPGPVEVTENIPDPAGENRGSLTGVGNDKKAPYGDGGGVHQEGRYNPAGGSRGPITGVGDDKAPYDGDIHQNGQYHPAGGDLFNGESGPESTTVSLQHGWLGMSEGKNTGMLNKGSGVKHEHGDELSGTERQSTDEEHHGYGPGNNAIWPEEAHHGTSQDVTGDTLDDRAGKHEDGLGKGARPVSGVKPSGGESGADQQVKFHVGGVQEFPGNTEGNGDETKSGTGHVVSDNYDKWGDGSSNTDDNVRDKGEWRHQNYDLPPGDGGTDVKGKVGHGLYSHMDDDDIGESRVGNDRDQNIDLHTGRGFGKLDDQDLLGDENKPVDASDVPDLNSGVKAPSTEGGVSQEVPSGVTVKPGPNIPTTQEPEGTTRTVVKFWGYNTPQELEIGHSRWDKNGDGKVDPEDLRDFFGPHITSEDLDNYRKYDMDNDGLLNLDETMMAAGFDPLSKQGMTTEKLSGVMEPDR